jgi:hypothetical protein
MFWCKQAKKLRYDIAVNHASIQVTLAQQNRKKAKDAFETALWQLTNTESELRTATSDYNALLMNPIK